ncbi:winged helix-turn-helix transcriptional regulator [Raoultella terrigena]|uniref:winged helix-turn-helix transcriptional regulator n=1 Tax=Raoultella terrigena TaxID=577 RepID=UPI0005F84F76|nr:helix-turn-helix domain-containing protein [Raoultella terrigena]
MMKNDTCPVARSVDIIGDRWSLLIVRDAFDGMSRFSDFQRSLGMARNILSDRLQKLVAADILRTQPASDGTAYQEYVLTEKGERLFPLVVALRQWGERYLFASGEPHSVLIDKRTLQAVPPMAPTTEDGFPLLPSATEVRKVQADG